MTSAQAGFIYSGDINPATDPSSWTNGTSGTLAYIGNTGNGALTVNGGSSMTAFRSYIGNYAGGSGTVTVTGPGSMWTGNSTIYAGYDGAGVMNITNGGVVGAKGAYFGNNTGSNGSGTVDGSGSALNVLSSLYVGYDGNGTLNITNGGTVAASGLRLANSIGTTGTVNISGAGSKLALINIATNNAPFVSGRYGNGVISITNGGTMESVGSFQMGLNTEATSTINVDGVGSSWNSSNYDNSGFSVAPSGNATLNITNGGTVTTNAYGVSIADNFTTGSVTVDGPGSTWSVTTTDRFYVSRMGNGKLNITNGGKVISNGGTLTVGPFSGSGGSGTITVNGSGSSFSHDGVANLGPLPGSTYLGIGRLIISDGGAASASSLTISSTSLLSADVGRGSSLKIGSTGAGAITNNGTIRLVAGAAAANGTYTPMSYGTMTGSGSVQALGGVWNSTNRTVTVSSAVATTTGNAATMDLYTNQRGIVTDPATGKSVGLGFQAAGSPNTNLTFAASAIGGTELSSLQSILAAGQSVLSGWDFITTGYTEGNPVYLSLSTGSGQTLPGLSIWGYSGSAWAKITPTDLAYDGNYASFTVNDSKGYAVSGAAPVPIPAALPLFGSGLALLGFVRRKFFRG